MAPALVSVERGVGQSADEESAARRAPDRALEPARRGKKAVAAPTAAARTGRPDPGLRGMALLRRLLHLGSRTIRRRVRLQEPLADRPRRRHGTALGESGDPLVRES